MNLLRASQAHVIAVAISGFKTYNYLYNYISIKLIAISSPQSDLEPSAVINITTVPSTLSRTEIH